MNPHFIFNVLNAVQYSILNSNPKEAVTSLSKFGKLIRDILESSRAEFISLERETRIITNYLEVQKNRLSNQFTFDIIIETINPKEDLLIPPMLLQPILENAIEHGVKPLTKEGLISIKIVERETDILFRISDNGVGINEFEKPEHKSLALEIMEQRLSIFNKRSNNLKVISEKGKGTTIEFKVPVKLN